MEVPQRQKRTRVDDPITKTITVSVSVSQYERFMNLRRRLMRFDPDKRMQTYARLQIIELMDRLEQILDEQEKRPLPHP